MPFSTVWQQAKKNYSVHGKTQPEVRFMFKMDVKSVKPLSTFQENCKETWICWLILVTNVEVI